VRTTLPPTTALLTRRASASRGAPAGAIRSGGHTLYVWPWLVLCDPRGTRTIGTVAVAEVASRLAWGKPRAWGQLSRRALPWQQEHPLGVHLPHASCRGDTHPPSPHLPAQPAPASAPQPTTSTRAARRRPAPPTNCPTPSSAWARWSRSSSTP
jgi:hypothetical protein